MYYMTHTQIFYHVTKLWKNSTPNTGGNFPLSCIFLRNFNVFTFLIN